MIFIGIIGMGGIDPPFIVFVGLFTVPFLFGLVSHLPDNQGSHFAEFGFEFLNGVRLK
jgi:hypothetical protein